MSNDLAYTIFAALFIATIIWIIFTYKFSIKLLASSQLPTNLAFNQSLENAGLVKTLNLGVLIFTPIWLLRNGLWFHLFLYVAGTIIFGLAMTAALSIYYFLFGTKLSWKDGSPWGNDVEEFLDEQYVWSFIAFIWIGTTSILTLLSMFNII